MILLLPSCRCCCFSDRWRSNNSSRSSNYSSSSSNYSSSSSNSRSSRSNSSISSSNNSSSNSGSSNSSSSKMLSWLSPAIRRPESLRNPPDKVYPASAEQQQQQQAEQQQAEQQEQQQQQKLFLEDPLNPEVVARRTAARVPFFEVKEIAELEKKEMKKIKEQIGKEIRDMCREILDDYVECMMSRTLTFLRCRGLAREVNRCISKYETPEFLERRIKELKAEREAKGISILRRRERQPYNKFISDA
ncbi:hypothetical protein Efla_002059 [Eimeria flavescens]